MSDLEAMIDGTRETIAEFARQIDAGEYGNRWTVENVEHEDLPGTWTVLADNEDSAIEQVQALVLNPPDDGWLAERVPFDEPTICDVRGNELSIDDWPLEVVVKIGRPLAVVIGTGGPHIEIVHDIGDGRAKLAGYWGGERVYRHGDDMQTVLDYFTDPLWDEAPEEYK